MAGDRVVAELSNVDPLSAHPLIAFLCPTKKLGTLLPKEDAVFVISTKQQLLAGGCLVVGSAKPSWVHRSGRGSRRDPRDSLRWKRE